MQKFERREAVTLINHDQKIFAVLHLPLKNSSAPVVLVCPGYGGNKCDQFRLSVRLSQELAKKGIASLRFDYRGTGDSEGEFEELTIESQVSDTVCCLNYLKLNAQIDTKKIALLGRSLGGLIAILATQSFQSVKSLGLWAPVFNSQPWQSAWKRAQSQQSLTQAEIEILKKYSSSFSNHNFLNQFFQVDLTPDLLRLKTVPFLHIQGDLDTVVTQEHAQAYRHARSESSCSRFITLPYSDHAFSHLGEQKIIVEETCQWYQQTLLDKDTIS